jgi:hypothetical protein
MRGAAIALASVLALGAAPASSADRACAESRQLVDRCFWQRGELHAWNGHPTFRISIGRGRLLGVEDAARGDTGRLVPPEVEALFKGDAFTNAVRGDFRVCPFTRKAPGRMRYVCISDARKLSQVKRP